ncbi:hypothetical protein [Nostoc sp. TCL26-01]|uniref:hypothetical protein n=1 Tax=Nostoc sp. TCL26-01 TaxID=2576904 RepID=UPI0015C1029A|nr:hypothetical protein [Nostoc sp. TCL26-01]QLE55449.1 hypothetical protein FD725_07920 [Nostoc sp. TCL26-01]
MPVDNFSRYFSRQAKVLRKGLMAQLYATKPINPFGSPEEQNGLLLSDLLGSFKRYAGNQQTAYDSGSVQSSPTNTSNQWERVVDRAINQALGKSPGKGANNFVNALDNAFSRTGYSQSTMAMPMIGAENYSTKGLLAEVSTEQAILYRQVNINMADALKVLAGIQYFSPQADKESVEALRELIRGRITFLVEEFRRADEPRADLVESYLRSLDEYTTEFGKQAYLDSSRLTVIEDEEQVTNFQLFKSYLNTLRDAWARYYNAQGQGRSDSLSLKVDRARVLLPIVSQANLDFSNALESVGLSENERRSRASLFTELDSPTIVEYPDGDSPETQNINSSDIERNSTNRRFINIILGNNVNVFLGDRSPSASSPNRIPNPENLATWLPNITVSDLIDWLDRYSNIEAPSALDSTYGIDFVTDQANRLFWTIAPIVTNLKTVVAANPSSQYTLKQILSNERVIWSLDNILSQLNALADLADLAV